MINWKPYPNQAGEYAEIGAMILEAHANGSWVVRHAHGQVGAWYSEMEPVINPGANMASAKAKAEAAMNSMLTSATDDGARERKITRRLCERYEELRNKQREYFRTKDQGVLAESKALEAALDRDVKAYLNPHVQP